jgi:hypothetical protein
MGKAARRVRRAEAQHRSAHGVAGAAADEARQAFEQLWAALEDELTEAVGQRLGPGRRVRIRPQDVHRSIRGRHSEGWSWPSTTYAPATLCGAMVLGGLADALGIDRSQLSDDAYAAHVGVQVASLLAWHRAPLVAVFDDQLAAALVATPMNGDIPRALLQRLPSWSIYIPLPWLRDHAGVFVSYDTGRMSQPGRPDTEMDDDLVMQFTVVDEDPLIAFFRCSEPTIGSSMESQFRDLAMRGRAANAFNAAESDRRSQHLLGIPYRHSVEQVMSLALYLCSDEPDVVPASLGSPGTTRPSTGVASPNVVEVGYRVGAALRASGRGNTTGDGSQAHARPTPHVRAAHWHTYWYGPRTDSPARTARLRWISPILVNAGDEVPVPTARPVSR